MTGPHPSRSHRRLPPGVRIAFEDENLLVVEKPHGLLTVATDRRTDNTLYAKLTEYVRKGNSKSRNRVFIVHRLDRDASGLLVFAKSEPVKRALQDGWEETKKVYLVVVHGAPKETAGLITSYLVENGVHTVRSTRDSKAGKLSRTGFRVLKSQRGLSLLEVDLLTGRKHQIRAHLSEFGHPIVGDMKYGAPNIGEKRLALHAKSLAFRHPVTRAVVAFDSETPGYFNRLLRSPDSAAEQDRSRSHAIPKKAAHR